MSKLKKYRFHWNTGKPTDGEGTTPEDAFTRLGYGAGAVAALDYWEEIKPGQEENTNAD